MLKNSTKRHEQKNRCCHRKSDPQPHGEAPSIAEWLRWGGSQQTEKPAPPPRFCPRKTRWHHPSTPLPK